MDDAETARKITDGSTYISEMSAAPGGALFALVVAADSDLYTVFMTGRLVVVDGEGEEVAAWQEGRALSNPRFSADGRKVAVVASTVGLSAANALVVLDAQTGESRVLTEDFDPTIVGMSWLDHDTIAFVSLRGTTTGVYSVAGVSNYISRYGNSDVNHGEAALWEFRDLPTRNLDFFIRSSPIAHLAGSATPTLIMHGEKDSRVPVGQSRELYRALRDLGVEVKLVLYPDAGHSIDSPKHFADLTRRWLSWYRKHLGMDEAPQGE